MSVLGVTRLRFLEIAHCLFGLLILAYLKITNFFFGYFLAILWTLKYRESWKCVIAGKFPRCTLFENYALFFWLIILGRSKIRSVFKCSVSFGNFLLFFWLAVSWISKRREPWKRNFRKIFKMYFYRGTKYTAYLFRQSFSISCLIILRIQNWIVYQICSKFSKQISKVFYPYRNTAFLLFFF